MLFQLLFGTSRVYAFTVHENPTPPADRIDRAEALRFVKDGFSGQAALTAPLWFATHRLWVPLAGYLVVAAALFGGYQWLGLPLPALIAGMIALHLFAGFEADVFERAELERNGWTSLGAVTGSSALECQRRFFDQWLERQPILSRGAVTAPVPAPNPQLAPKPVITSARGAQSAAGRLAALWRGSRS